MIINKKIFIYKLIIKSGYFELLFEFNPFLFI